MVEPDGFASNLEPPVDHELWWRAASMLGRVLPLGAWPQHRPETPAPPTCPPPAPPPPPPVPEEDFKVCFFVWVPYNIAMICICDIE